MLFFSLIIKFKKKMKCNRIKKIKEMIFFFLNQKTNRTKYNRRKCVAGYYETENKITFLYFFRYVVVGEEFRQKKKQKQTKKSINSIITNVRAHSQTHTCIENVNKAQILFIITQSSQRISSTEKLKFSIFLL